VGLLAVSERLYNALDALLLIYDDLCSECKKKLDNVIKTILRERKRILETQIS
jgi:hypothetical protein